MRVESHLPGGTATGGCRGPDDPPPLDPTHDVHYTYIAIKMHSSYLVQLFRKIMPYYDNFWHKDTHENVQPPACMIFILKVTRKPSYR